MKTNIRNLVILASLIAVITGCSVREVIFANSSYGVEMQSMMNTCMDMQKKGLLPGIESGEPESLKFKSDDVRFSKRNDVAYPVQLNCVVIKQGREHTFFFVKHSSTSEWKLSQ